MEALRFYENMANFYWTTRRHMPENNKLHSHRYENRKSKKIIYLVLRCTVMRELRMQYLNRKINYTIFLFYSLKMLQLEEELTSLHFKLAL
jgi:hypothetical protein